MQEHQAWFGGGGGTGSADEALARAWREREPAARVACARAALALRPDCAAALLLLAEEDAPTVLEVGSVAAVRVARHSVFVYKILTASSVACRRSAC